LVTVSVIIPARNAEATLGETLDSLRAQTHRDWTAWVVDDGSTDGTRALAQSYATRDARIRVLGDSRASEGASAARNRGIAEATGEWLLFLDSDDWIETAFLQKMLAVLAAHRGARVAYSACRRVSPNGHLGPQWLSSEVARAPFEVLARQCPVVIHGFLIDRALIDEIGGFDPGLRTCEDWDFWHRLARTGVAFHPVADAVAYYRLRAQSLSSDAHAMLADARIVIDRGFAADPRVRHPAPRHAAGADPGLGAKETTLGHFALWCAAFSVGDGGDGKNLVLPLPDRWGNIAEACRTTILAGLRARARIQPDELLSHDPAFVARVRALLDEVERAAERPGLARLLEHMLEAELFRPGHLTARMAIDRTLLVRQDVSRIAAIEVPAEIDTLQAEFRITGREPGWIEVPVFASLSKREVTDLAIDAVSLGTFINATNVLGRPRFWIQLAIEAVRDAPALVRDWRHGRPSLRPHAKHIARRATLATYGSASDTHNDGPFAALVDEVRAEADRFPLPPAKQRADTGSEAGPPDTDRRAYWESVYSAPDPWAYGSAYEQLKYQRTLSLLPPGPIARAMELACSEGWFTTMLAPRVGHLTASDISETALGRARQRCATLANVDYHRLDFFDEPLPNGLDLLVCSEVLYDLRDETALQRVATKLATALKPGGHLLTAHARLLKDDPTRTGFDWDSAFGAEGIARALTAAPGIALARSLHTELYRIDLYRKRQDGETAAPPQINTIDLGPPPEPAYAQSIVWGGAEARRAEVQARESVEQLPILNYHRIATGGPPDLARYRTAPESFREQMRWLRRHGYHAVTSADLIRHRTARQPFRGRPVLITFDDGYLDFHDTAWPILQAHDFVAEIFIVTDRVGDTAQWDAAFGTPAPLMGWPQIQALGAAGIRFGSHMASHSHMNTLSSREIVREAARSRALLERALGTTCVSIAAPFGEASDRFVRIAGQCGYKIGVTVEPGIAHLGSNPLRLPRIEVLGHWSLEEFVSAVRPIQ
jgi:glycosyltransferase involved in cell wall biosynthesis/peptidoglycan/xylan/chitin deacetylase (PgdA/CDA1 family)/SAM-dependent methyltransferase